MTKDIQKWADSAMFESEPMPEGHDVKRDGPRVYFLQGTPDPLGSIVAFSAMYSGKVIRSKSDVTDEERRHHLEEMKKTKLKAPMEAVDLHFMIDGLHRGVTHQMVRQRTAVFAQESMRFAVVEGVTERVSLPPSLAGTRDPSDEEMSQYLIDSGDVRRQVKGQEQQWRTVWEHVMETIDEAYTYLVNDGMPAEDARGMLPTNITTRINYHTNLRNLQDHAGMRLCTQAQFEWRHIWTQFVREMSNYCTCPSPVAPAGQAGRTDFSNGHEPGCDNWQWKEIAGLFRPVCYFTGKCEFGAEVDRKCKIRERVQANHAIGRPSSEWDEPFRETSDGENFQTAPGMPVFIGAISPAEWLLDPKAAR